MAKTRTLNRTWKKPFNRGFSVNGFKNLMKKIDNFTLEELARIVEKYNEPGFRAKQIYHWIHGQGLSDYGGMTNVSLSLREKLASDYDFTSFDEVKRTTSGDGSIKFLFKLEDGHFIESVLLRDSQRMSGCISTQVGCRMGCKFCATASAVGFKRDLTVAEILKQVRYLATVSSDLFDINLRNLVFMGMGEPLDNMVNLKKSLAILTDEDTFGFSHRKVTVSTCGLIDGILELFKSERPVNLAVSINAADQEKRCSLMPVSKKYPIAKLFDTLKGIELDKRKRITLEYVMLAGVNDSITDAKKLADMAKHMKVKINLIIYNGSEYGEFKSPEMDKTLAFQNYLIERKFAVFIRKRLCEDVGGACGQLAAEYKRAD